MKDKMKAKFVAKYYGRGYEKDYVFLEYEYRGHVYTVYENRARGNEPLSWQHKSEQARIDKLIEIQNMPKDPNAEPAQVGLDMFFDYVNQEQEVMK